MRRLLVVALAVLAAGCGDASAEPEPLPVTFATAVPSTADLAMDVYHPEAPGPWPVVVLVPGGSWRSADLESTAPLAAHIAGQGAVVFNATYRLRAPEAYADVACAVRAAAARAAGYGGDPARLVLAGVSAGAHVSSVAALSGEARCGDGPPPALTAWVGVAGPYDVDAFSFLPDLRRFFGGAPESTPEAWAQGDPYRYLADPPDLRIGLIHGEADIVVPPRQSRDLAAALDAAGAEVATTFLDGIGHRGIGDPDVGGDAVAAFLLSLAG